MTTKWKSTLYPELNSIKALFLLEEQTMRILAAWVAKIPKWELKYELGCAAYQTALRADRLRTVFLELCGVKSELYRKQQLVHLWERLYDELQTAEDFVNWLIDWRRNLQDCYLELAKQIDPLWDYLLANALEQNLLSLQQMTSVRPRDTSAQTNLSFREELQEWWESSANDMPYAGQKDEPHPRYFHELPVSKRDDRFSYVDSRSYTPNLDSEKQAMQLFLHGIADTEMHAAEVCGRNLYEFPHMPWEFYLDMARQLNDEVRHSHLAESRLSDFGGEMGMFPVIEGQYAHRVQKDLLHRLGDMNLYSERLALIRAKNRTEKLTQRGDHKTAKLFYQIMMEEAVHVQIGYRWVKDLLGGDMAQMKQLLQQTASEREQISFVLLQRHGARYMGLSDQYAQPKMRQQT